MKTILCFLFCLLPLLAVGSQPAEKAVTFFVLQAGDGSLAESMKAELEKMKKVGSSDQVNVVVLQDLGSLETTKILYVQNGTADVVFDYKSNIDTGNWETLVGFFAFVKRNYPAQKYILNISSHGSGWMDHYEGEDKGISFDDTTGNNITTFQLGKALEKIKDLNGGKKLFVFEMYACIMSSLEILYELADSVEYVVASPSLTYSKDADYQKTLQFLVTHPDTAGLEYLKQTVGVSDSDSNSFFVGIATDSLHSLATSMKQYTAYLESILQSKMEKILAGVTRGDTLAYKVSGYRRFETVLEAIEKNVNDAELSRLTLDIQKQIGQIVLVQSDSSKIPLQGFSIWLPLIQYAEVPTQKRFYEEYRESYTYLKWEKDTNWLRVIDHLALMGRKLKPEAF